MPEPAMLSCQICWEAYTCEEFKVFSVCGHGYCSTCTETHFAQRETRPCPACRKKIHKIRDVHPIFLQFADPKVVFTDKVTEGFGKMDGDTPLESVKRGVEKLDKAAKMTKGDGDLTGQLLRALEDFKQRLVPVFEVQQGLRSEIASLKAQLRKEEKERRSLETQVQRLEKLPSQVAELKRESDRATELADAATLAADEMKNRMLALQKEKEQAEGLLAVEVGEKNRYRNMSVQNHEAGKRTREKLNTARADLQELKERYKALEERHEQETQVSLTSPVRQSQLDYDEDSQRHPLQTLADDNTLDFEGLPRPGFGSSWQLKRTQSYSKLSKTASNPSPSHRRVTNPFPLRLDSKGKPKSAIQVGPKRSCRV
ncbi:hypothetical protein FA13DRAFT_1741392 [Coprinellus micaceus]|uniref:RING-type domain-containing protein n=1 Tax=Coprinellus micaceus TaxID=71717 RepID=A0A4Y7SJS7_COPMI|nr:hypothetical protein FA13DRAFT_1741392 [Coprinellus micaceus]